MDPDRSDSAEEAGDAPAAPTGPHVVAAYLKRLPDAPGVYRMLGADGSVLYVGKARSLVKRVASYAQGRLHGHRIARMVALTASMEFVVTASETEALLLEANLIKRLKPRFNVSYRDDKSFPYILVREDHAVPQLLKHRGAHTTKGHYFGPFASAGAVARTLNTLQRAFLLRSCSDSVLASRTRPCLLYQIKRCSAPCTGRIAPDDYNELVREAVDFLEGRSRAVQTLLEGEMDKAAAALDFEKAARYRDRIRALAHVQQHQGINPRTVREADLFAVHEEGGSSCVQVFFFRLGQNWGNRAYFPRHEKSFGPEEILESFLAQFYDDKEPPRTVLLSHDVPGRALLAEALSVKAGRAVEVLVPRRAEKRELVEHALQNAREALARRMAESASQRALLEGVADVFGLEAPPRRIEVYDNSHIQGANAVGAMIVAGPDGLAKGQYRKFNIRSTELAPGDDYAMMGEVLTRRFARLMKENPDREIDGDSDTRRSQWPDLVLIDGGEGQLSAARQVLRDLGVENVALAAISKGPDRNAGREQFHVPDRPAFMLEPKSPVLYFLQRLRDEAHRFAIGTHRAKRSREIGATPLDDIAGIGAARKRALIRHFGSARAVERATLADLESVEGVSRGLARRIYDHFRTTTR